MVRAVFLNDDQVLPTRGANLLKKLWVGTRCNTTRAEVQPGWGPRFKNSPVANGVLRIPGDLRFYQALPVYTDLCAGGPLLSDTRGTKMQVNLNEKEKKKGVGPPKKPTEVAPTTALASSAAVARPLVTGRRGGLSDRAGPSTSAAGGSGGRGGLGRPAFNRFTAEVVGSTPLRVNKPHSTSTSVRGRGMAPASRFNRQVVVERPGSSKQVAKVSKEGLPRHVRPSKQAYYEKKAAMRVLSRLGDLPADQLTEEQTRSVEWAKGVVSSLGKPADTALKRQRSAERIGERVAKKPKTGGHKYPTFSEVVKGGGEVLAIVDRAEEEGTIPKEKWRWVEEAIAEVYLRVLKESPGPPPICHDAGWYQGRAKLIACKDKRSAQLYRLAVSKVGEVWPGAKLEAVSKEEIPSRPRARVWIPAKPAEPENIEQIFRSCNEDLPTQNWKVGKIEEPVEGRRQVLLILNAETLAPLAKKGWKVRFGFVDATVRIYRSDESALELGEETHGADLNSGDEEGLHSSQYSTDSERLTGVGPLFNEEDLLADDTEGEEIAEEGVDVTMVEAKRTDSYETDPNKPPSF